MSKLQGRTIPQSHNRTIAELAELAESHNSTQNLQNRTIARRICRIAEFAESQNLLGRPEVGQYVVVIVIG
jgi:hypothetical protein